ncbi:MAG: hypothetical protein ACYCOU_18025 [Sulfobacillus sp.]
MKIRKADVGIPLAPGTGTEVRPLSGIVNPATANALPASSESGRHNRYNQQIMDYRMFDPRAQMRGETREGQSQGLSAIRGRTVEENSHLVFHRLMNPETYRRKSEHNVPQVQVEGWTQPALPSPADCAGASIDAFAPLLPRGVMPTKGGRRDLQEQIRLRERAIKSEPIGFLGCPTMDRNGSDIGQAFRAPPTPRRTAVPQSAVPPISR